MMMFLLCGSGSFLAMKFERVADAAYDIEWYNFPVKYQLNVLVIMQRAQMPFELTGMQLIVCSNETFKKVNTSIEFAL